MTKTRPTRERLSLVNDLLRLMPRPRLGEDRLQYPIRQRPRVMSKQPPSRRPLLQHRRIEPTL